MNNGPHVSIPSTAGRDNPAGGTRAVNATRGRRNRPRAIADALKDWIADRGLQPGDRLPQEKQLIELFGVSRGTMREALKVLEAQGLIRTRTGPTGGAYINDVSMTHAIELLGNYFFFKDITIRDIYDLRKRLEPELAASLVGVVSGADIQRLQDTMTLYERPPQSQAEEREQRFAELAFHETLAELCPNAVLAFVCQFLIRLLRELTLCHRIYERPLPVLREGGRSYQIRLLDALRAGDTATVRAVMAEHMAFAQSAMEAQEAEVQRQFLRPTRAGG